MKQNKKIIITIMTMLLLSTLAYAYIAPLQNHPPEQVTKGVYGDDYYYFNNTMYVNVTNGLVGIGLNNPLFPLHVVGNTYLNGNANISGTLYASTISSNSPLILQTAGITRIYVNDTTGNVGIGTTNPTQMLDVNGSVNVSGTLYASNVSSNSPLRLQTSGVTRVYVNDTSVNVSGTLYASNVSSEGLQLLGLQAGNISSDEILTVNSSGVVKKTTITAFASSMTPPGAIMIFAGTTAPTGWLLCNGSSISTTTYSDLFTVIGYTYGGAGANFSLPNISGRVVVGVDTTKSEFNNLNKTGGEINHTLTTPEIPSHVHTSMVVGYGSNFVDAGAFYGLLDGGWSNTGSTGGGESHNNLQPYITLNYIIKT